MRRVVEWGLPNLRANTLLYLGGEEAKYSYKGKDYKISDLIKYADGTQLSNLHLSTLKVKTLKALIVAYEDANNK